MANHKDAAKRSIQASRARVRNRAYRTRMRNQIAELRTKMASSTDAESVQSDLRETISTIHRLVTKGVIHRNQAARRVARLTAAATSAKVAAEAKPAKPAKPAPKKKK